MRNVRFLLFLLFLSVYSSAKVLILTHCYNRPDFIELQVKTFKAFLQDEYEYVVFNDARGQDMKSQIENVCAKHGVRCFYIPQQLHASPGDPGARHIDGMKYSFNTLAYDYDGIVALVDSDVFLIKPFSIERYLEGYDLAAKLEGRANNEKRVQHLSPILVFMNMKTLPNKRTLHFGGGWVNGLPCDVGSQTYYYLQNNPSIKKKFFTAARIFFLRQAMIHSKYFTCRGCANMTCSECVYHLMDNGFDANAIDFIQSCPDDMVEFVLEHTFVHYRCGSNWDGKSDGYHSIKTKALNKLIDSTIKLLDSGLAR